MLDERLVPVSAPPAPPHPLSARDILLGAPLTPQQVISTYDSDEWERFTAEWAWGAVRGRYASVFNPSGPGDKGRDVVAYVDEDIQHSECDVFQCKHYDTVLSPGEAWVELGKLCWNTFRGVYRVPRRYYFVAPHGPGPSLLLMLENPEQFRSGLLEAWDTKCARQIERGKVIELAGELRRHVETFDFGILRAMPVLQLISEHATTRYHAMRFGGGLRRTRPGATVPPPEVTPDEARYVRLLLDAYGDALGTDVPDVNILARMDEGMRRHLTRQREWFFKAASLRQFERDSLPDDRGFVSLMNQVYDGIVDVHDRDYAHALARVNASLDAAAGLHISAYVLRDDLEPADLKGVCHHIANERARFSWCERGDAA